MFRQPSDEEKFVSSRSRRRSLSSESNSSSTAVMAEQAHVAIPPGIVIGSDYFFVRDTSFRIRSYMVSVYTAIEAIPANSTHIHKVLIVHTNNLIFHILM